MAVSGSLDGTVNVHTIKEGQYIRTLHAAGRAGVERIIITQLWLSDRGDVVFSAEEKDNFSIQSYTINGERIGLSFAFTAQFLCVHSSGVLQWRLRRLRWRQWQRDYSTHHQLGPRLWYSHAESRRRSCYGPSSNPTFSCSVGRQSRCRRDEFTAAGRPPIPKSQVLTIVYDDCLMPTKNLYWVSCIRYGKTNRLRQLERELGLDFRWGRAPDLKFLYSAVPSRFYNSFRGKGFRARRITDWWHDHPPSLWIEGIHITTTHRIGRKGPKVILCVYMLTNVSFFSIWLARC